MKGMPAMSDTVRSGSSNPAPRPALQKSPDARVHPAAPHAVDTGSMRLIPPRRPSEQDRTDPVDLPVERRGARPSPEIKPVGKKPKAGKAKKSAKPKKLVKVEIEIPKDVLAALQERAKSEGVEPDRIVTALIRGWLC